MQLVVILSEICCTVYLWYKGQSWYWICCIVVLGFDVLEVMGFCVLVTCVMCAVFCCNWYIDVFTLDAGLLARCQCSERPATGHLDTGFLSWFPCVFNPQPTELTV